MSDTLNVRIHDLKCRSEFFEAIRLGLKTNETRKNDRDYRVGDVLLLRETTPFGYKGPQLECLVTYIAHPSEFTPLAEGYVILSLRRLP